MRKWFLGAALLLVSVAASAQISVSKSCDASALVGATINCSFQVDNDNLSVSTTSLSVTNTVPFPGGVPQALVCKVGGVPTTVIGPGQSCFGTFTETAPSCSAGTFNDRIEATGHQNAPGPETSRLLMIAR